MYLACDNKAFGGNKGIWNTLQLDHDFSMATLLFYSAILNNMTIKKPKTGKV